MIELVRHIEILLLENDCVVIPGFGGFITHYMPATWDDKENVFFPPTRTIGFNPQLRMNDGILVQSYMNAYNTDFSDATKILEQEVSMLIDTLHKDGKVDLPNLGELTLSIHGIYVFSPHNNEIVSPLFYGLDVFEIKDVAELQQSLIEQDIVPQYEMKNKETYEIRINRALVRNAVAAVAAILLFFYMSAPIENTYVENSNYAQLLPADLFGKIEQQSLLTASVIATPDVAMEIQPIEEEEMFEAVPEVIDQVEIVVPEPVEEIKKPSKLHHIIIASVTSEIDAQKMASKLNEQGYPDARVLTGDNRIRISIASYAAKAEADIQLGEIRKNDIYKNAWLLVR